MAAVSENIMVAGDKRSRDEAEASNAGTVDEDSVADTVDEASDSGTVDEEEDVDTSFPPPEDHPFRKMKNEFCISLLMDIAMSMCAGTPPCPSWHI